MFFKKKKVQESKEVVEFENFKLDSKLKQEMKEVGIEIGSVKKKDLVLFCRMTPSAMVTPEHLRKRKDYCFFGYHNADKSKIKDPIGKKVYPKIGLYLGKLARYESSSYDEGFVEVGFERVYGQFGNFPIKFDGNSGYLGYVKLEPDRWAFQVLDDCYDSKSNDDYISPKEIESMNESLNSFIDNRIKEKLQKVQENKEKINKIRVSDSYREKYKQF
ncbi:MAG: hypothetical protein J6J24_02940 [Clostridia bacterium]|nr:hypothetical protein [Clostridia bacterium]